MHISNCTYGSRSLNLCTADTYNVQFGYMHISTLSNMVDIATQKRQTQENNRHHIFGSAGQRCLPVQHIFDTIQVQTL